MIHKPMSTMAYALLQHDGTLQASPILEDMTTRWESVEQWWRQFSAQTASPALTQCPVCHLGQRLGTIRSSLFAPEIGGDVRRAIYTFEITFTGHCHLLDPSHSADLLLIQDVTQQQQQNEVVRRKIGQYESICTFIQDVYYRIDLEGNILFISPSCDKLLHYNPEELLGTSLAQLATMPESFQELLDILQNTDVVHDFYLLMLCKKGHPIPVSLTAKLVLGADGQRLAIEGIFRDISERERLDTLLEERTLTYKTTIASLEQLLRSVDQHAMVSVTNPDGQILTVNDKFLEVSRYGWEDVIGQTHRVLHSGYHPKSFFKEMWRILLSGSVWHGEIRNRKKNGDLFWVECTIVPFLTSLGRPFQYVCVATDISAQVRTRTRLERNRDFLHRVIDAMGDGVIVMDLQGRLLALNQEGERLLGWREAELIHKNVHEAIHFKRPDGSVLATSECTVHQSLLGRAFRAEDDHYVCKDGSFLPVAHVTTPLREDKEIIGSVAVFRDNARFRKRHLELEKLRDAALQSAQLKSDFLANMSHEVRTPMNAIVGMNNMLMDTALDREQLEFATIIRDSAISLLALINDILDFSKIEAGKMDIEEIPFAPVAVVEGCAELLAPQAHAKNISLMTFVSPELPKMLQGDPSRLRQMLLNLVSNAIKFTEVGEVVVRVEHDADVSPTMEPTGRVMVRFSVIDTGIGLTEQTKELLFEPFLQADRSTNRKYGGTGLGLAISKRLAELMGGTIGVDTAVSPQFGEGSHFWFCIPLRVAATVVSGSDRLPSDEGGRDGMVSDSVVSDSVGEDGVILTDALQDVRILTLLGNDTDQTILAEYCCAWGMVQEGVVVDSSDLAAVRQALEIYPPFPLAVIAITAEGGSNHPLLQTRNVEQLSKTTKLIALINKEDKLLREFILDAGFSACLSKPVRQDAWVHCFTHWLAVDRMPSGWSLRPASDAGQVPERLVVALPDQASGIEEGDDTYDALETGRLLLLVEDNPVNQRVTLLQLKKMGYAARVVSNGQEAVEAVTNLPYALILMDCQMPVMDGFEATRVIRKMYESGENRASWHHIPIIAMTANAMKGDRERCLQAGMDDYLSKPVSPETLLQKLQYWIPQASGQRPPIRIQQLRQLFGDDDGMIRELLQHFPASVGELLERLRQSVQETDRAMLNDTAFELQEACANMGAVGMVAVARTLEHAAVKQDWAKARTAMEQIEREFRRVEDYVRDY